MCFCKAYVIRNSHLKHTLEEYGLELTSNAATRTRPSPYINSGDELEDSTSHFTESAANVSNEPELLVEISQAPPSSLNQFL